MRQLFGLWVFALLWLSACTAASNKEPPTQAAVVQVATPLPVETPTNPPTQPPPATLTRPLGATAAPTQLATVTAVPLPTATLRSFSALPENPVVNRRVDDPNEYYINPLIPFDGIYPVYEPQFAPAAEASLEPDELVMGVAWGGEAKAYPVSVMRFREMVDDELAGIPILVTW